MREILKKAVGGDIEAINKIWEDNINLFKKISNKYSRDDIPFEDLLQDCYIYYRECISNYKPYCSLTTFLWNNIVNRIYNSYNYKYRTISLTNHGYDKLSQEEINNLEPISINNIFISDEFKYENDIIDKLNKEDKIKEIKNILNKKEWNLLYYYYFNNGTMRDIAKSENYSVSTAYKKISKIIEKIRNGGG